jgi:hypothetical protein
MKTAGVALALALAAGAAWAQDSGKGETKFAAWARANAGLDFESGTHMGDVPDMDPTGAGATLTWTKGKWTVEGVAEVTTKDLGKTYSTNGSVKTTYEDGDWKVYGKFAQDFDGADQSNYNWGRTLDLSAENWKQDANPWGVKAVAKLNVNAASGSPYLTYISHKDNKAGFFINFLDKQVLLEAGYGNFMDDVWKTPGPLEKQYESGGDKSSALRLQFKPAFLEGLNVGFAYLPGLITNSLNGGFADGSDTDSPLYGDPADTIRATTFGVKYAPSAVPVTVVTTFNLEKDVEKGAVGFSYKLLDKKLTLSLDTEGRQSGKFGQFDLGEKIVFVDDPGDKAATLEAGLTLKENRLINSSGGTSYEDFELVASPYAWYEFVPKKARAKVGLDLTKGLGDVNKDHIKWELTTTLGWSVADKPSTAVNDIGTGFVVQYKVGSEKDKYDGFGTTTPGETKTNKLYFGFKVSY